MAKWYEKAVRPFVPSVKVKNIGTDDSGKPTVEFEDGFDQLSGIGDAAGDAYNDLTGVTQARNIEDAQNKSINEARDYQTKMYNESKGMLSPYAEAGSNAMFGDQQYKTFNTPFGPQRIPTGRQGGLINDINAGEYRQDDFNYQGSQPEFGYDGQTMGKFDYQGPQMSSSVGYQGSQPDQFNYQGAGQRGSLDYQGSPVDRSIESYMQDDPSMAYQQEQMEKMINRQGAAKGRWGGGATAREMMRDTAGLLSKDYANRFERGRFERQADVDTEALGYDRNKYGTELSNLAEQSRYNRDTDQYDYNVTRDQTGYNRAFDDAKMGNEYAKSMYDQDKFGYQSGVDDEKSMYNRTYDRHKFDTEREKGLYDRSLKNYEIQGQNMQNRLSQQQGIANMGQNMATTMSNAALGQGTALSDLSIQQGNAAAASQAAQGTPWANGLNLYKAMQEQGTNAAKLLAGG